VIYPLLFDPILKEKIWGGRKLEGLFGRKLPAERIGESWDIACHKNGTSVVSNGIHKGKPLDLLIEELGIELLGCGLKDIEKFPLLVKMLDASDVLSVQVHPTDKYASIHENGELGKTEMWYIIDVEPGAYLYFGVSPGIDREEFKQAIFKGQVEPYLCKMPVEKGDVLYIPSGMVHAIGPGIVICEIQQNSDTTYRVFDWNRLGDHGNPRELHIDKALDVIDFIGQHSRNKIKGIEVKEDGGSRTYLVACPYFAAERLNIMGSVEEKANGEKFFILTIIEGQGHIEYNEGFQGFKKGDSIMIPANLGNYSISGECTLIKSYVPNRDVDIISVLKDRGYSMDDMKAIGGLFEDES
jgi:mannose-6-phosphate isomerase